MNAVMRSFFFGGELGALGVAVVLAVVAVDGVVGAVRFKFFPMALDKEVAVVVGR